MAFEVSAALVLVFAESVILRASSRNAPAFYTPPWKAGAPHLNLREDAKDQFASKHASLYLTAHIFQSFCR
jgi:hypothetical protein